MGLVPRFPYRNLFKFGVMGRSKDWHGVFPYIEHTYKNLYICLQTMWGYIVYKEYIISFHMKKLMN